MSWYKPGKDGGMPSEDSFQMFGVSTRFPEKLARQVSLQRRMQGVYETERGTDKIRVIVLNEITRLEHNSLWHLFSCVPAMVQFGASHHSLKTTDTSTILVRLFENYQFEGIMMPYTIQDFRRDFTLEHIHLLSDSERLEGVPPEKRLEGISPEVRLEGLSPKKRLEGLLSEELKRLLQEVKEKIDMEDKT